MAEPNANLQWRPTVCPPGGDGGGRTDDIWFVDPQIGWAVNGNGQIIKTTDGGASWTPSRLPEGTNVYWRCIGFATPQRGWAGTADAGEGACMRPLMAERPGN